MTDKNDGNKDVITLEFDDGAEVVCEIMGVFDANGKDYIALVPDDDSGDIYVYGYRELKDDEFELVEIEDENEYADAVAELETITGHTVEMQ